MKLLNFFMTIAGLAMVGYGIYLLVEYERVSDKTLMVAPVYDDRALVQFGRPMLMSISLSNDIFDKLPRAWYAYCSFLSLADKLRKEYLDFLYIYWKKNEK